MPGARRSGGIRRLRGHGHPSSCHRTAIWVQGRIHDRLSDVHLGVRELDDPRGAQGHRPPRGSPPRICPDAHRRGVRRSFRPLGGLCPGIRGALAMSSAGMGGLKHGGWSVNYWDDLMGQVMTEAMSKPFDLVLGRTTYDILGGYWPKNPEEYGAKPLNDATKYVASRGKPDLRWSPSVLIEGDAAEGLAALKKEDGPELQVH